MSCDPDKMFCMNGFLLEEMISCLFTPETKENCIQIWTDKLMSLLFLLIGPWERVYSKKHRYLKNSGPTESPILYEWWLPEVTFRELPAHLGSISTEDSFSSGVLCLRLGNVNLGNHILCLVTFKDLSLVKLHRLNEFKIFAKLPDPCSFLPHRVWYHMLHNNVLVFSHVIRLSFTAAKK